tara:strand:+ start:434 stop:730 length:297 start_codon:yes stop_codon:yes gene_type:complete
MKVEFNVKDESVKNFFKENALKCIDFDRGENIYYFFKDEIFLKKSDTLTVGTAILFKLKDKSEMSGYSLVNNYYYEIKEHDSMSVKLTLCDFKIEVIY